MRMTMSRIDSNNVNTCFHKCINTFHHICRHTNCSTTTKATACIFTCIWIVTHVINIFRCNQTHQVIFVINDRQFLNTIFPQYLFCLQKRSTHFSGYKVIFSHHLAHFCFVRSKIFQIAISNNTHKTIIIIHYRQTTDAIFIQQTFTIEQSAICRKCYRISNHTAFIAFHQIHFCRLFFDAHVFMDKTKTTFTSNSNSKCRFCHCVHCRTHKRNIQLNIASQMCFKTNLRWQHVRFLRNEQHIIKCQTCSNVIKFHIFSFFRSALSIVNRTRDDTIIN